MLLYSVAKNYPKLHQVGNKLLKANISLICMTDIPKTKAYRKTCIQKFRCSKKIRINATFHHSPSLNFVEVSEETKWIDIKGEEKLERNIFAWVTDFKIDTLEDVKLVMQGGRCRWKIENETFNTLKN